MNKSLAIALGALVFNIGVTSFGGGEADARESDASRSDSRMNFVLFIGDDMSMEDFLSLTEKYLVILKRMKTVSLRENR